MDLIQLSSMTRTLACKILERVREFKENFSGWDSVSQWVPGTDTIAKKVYHRQPSKPSAAKSAKAKKTTLKRSTASKGRSKKKK